MLKSEAAAYLAGVTQTEGAEASAPTNLHVITGEVGEASADGKTLVKIDGLMFSESDDQFIEVDALGGLEEGDIATIVLTGEQGHAMTPLALGSIGSVDRITVRIAAIEADYIKVEQLDAAEARIGDLEADHVSVDDLNAATARIGTLETTRATITDLEAATARIGDLEADHVSTDDLNAATARIGTLETNTADIGTIRANSAKVQNLTAAELEADHATIESLDSNYAHITNGVIDNATIGYADVNNLSAHYAEIQNGKINSALIDTAAIVDEQVFTVTGNKATLAQIDASKINVLNLKAKDIEVERINGQPVTNKTLVDALSQHETDISGLDTKIDNEVEALNDRIDGAIETFTGTVVPTLENTPASQWNTVKLKDQHVGDVYYVVNSQSAQNGYCYRFTKSGSAYSWQLIKDSDVTAALSRLQTAEGKISNIETFDETVGSFMTNTEDEISSLKMKDTQLETSLGDKVSTSTFNTVSQKVDTNEANITSMSTVLTNNGLTSSTNITNTVNTVKQTADTNKASITNLTQTVNNKADGSTVTTLTNRVSTVEQNLSGITTRVGKTESAIETVSNPNLSPFFSYFLSDVYSADNPDGYWHNSISTNYITKLNDGWAHIKVSNTGTNNVFANYFVVKSAIPESFKPSTKYTFLVETRNVTKSGTITVFATHNFTSQIHAFTASASFTLSEDENKYLSATSVSDWSSAALFTRGYVQVPGGASVEMDIRISIYEGEYSGPYKPYVDQTLSNRVKSAETAIEQNAEDITLRATKAETTVGGRNLLSGDAAMVHKWTNSMPSAVTVTGKEYEALYHMIKGVGGWENVYSPAIHVETGKIYTVSMDYSVESDYTPYGSGDQQMFGLEVCTQSGSTSNNFSTLLAKITFGVTAKERTRGSATFTATTDTIYLHLDGGYIKDGMENKDFIVSRLKLEEGSTATAYMPPYSDYATAAELKVANDNINLKVSKNDVINQINVSTEGAKIDADRVEINGTAIFSAIKSSADAAYDAKGAAATVQDNLDNLEVGGRNLLPQTQNWGKVSTSNGTGTITSDTKAGCQILKFVWGSGSADVFFTGKWTRPLEANAWYTLSFWARADAAIDLRNYLWSPAVVDEGRNSVGRTTSSSDGAIVTPITTSWERYWIAWHVKAGSSLPNNVMIGRLLSAGTVYFAGAKFEKGNKATDWTPAPEDQTAYVDDSISSIQVGGRNLLTDSDAITKCFDSSSNITSIVGGKADPDGGNGAYLITPNTTNWWAGPRGARLRLTKLGVSYTFSIWLRADNATQCQMCCRYMDSTPYSSNATRVNINVTTEWKRFFISAPLKQVQTGDSVWIGYLSTTPLYVYHPMVEMSSTPSDWSPAPEDIEANAVKRTQRIWYRKSASGAPATPGTASSNWVTKADDGNDAWTKMHIAINSTHKYIYTCEQYEMANGTVGYTSVLLDNTITVIDGGNIITGTVTANKLNAANINASKTLTVGAMTDAAASTILNSNVVVGGRNLLPKTGSADGYYANTVPSGNHLTTVNDDGECYEQSVTSTSANIPMSSNVALVGLESGSEYTLSMMVKSTVARTFGLQLRKNNNGADGGDYTYQSGVNVAANTWTRLTYSFTGTSDAAVYARLYCAAGTACTVRVRELQLERGNKATDWTPAPEDQTAYVDDSVSSIQVGGRNLLLNTGASQSKTMPAVAAGSYTTWDPYTMIGAYNTLGLTTSDSITVSFDWRVTGAAAGSTVKIGTNASPWEYFGVLITFAAGASSGHVEKSFAVTSTLASATGTTLRARIDAVGNAITTSMVLTISNVKLEKGNKATDWTPAPEDQTAYVDNLEIGGRNLLLATPTSYKQTSYDAYVIPSSTSATELGAGTTLTIQFWDVELDSNSSGIGGYWGGGSSGNLFLIKPDESGYCSKTFTIPTGTASHTQGANKWLCLYNLANGHSGMSLSIGKWKLEKGSKPTDWTPAPEDMATAESLAGTNESLEGAIADIGELSDQLVDTTTEQNKTITDIQKYLNSLRQDLDAEIQSRQQWLNFNSAEGLIIGATGSTFKTVTTNTSQQFRSGGTVLAETSGTEFVAPIMRSDQLLIGNWMWTRRDNGNLSLKWIG